MSIVCKPALKLPAHLLQESDVENVLHVLFGNRVNNIGRVVKIVKNAGIQNRYLVQSLADTIAPSSFSSRNKLYIDEVKRLGKEAAVQALDNAGIGADEIDLVISTSCTGFMIPSLCAYLIPDLGIKRSAKRLPITELGCAAGAVSLSRAREFCAVYPDANVLIIAAELCSLTFQPSDFSMQALVGSILFGDGVAACVVRGERAAQKAAQRANAGEIDAAKIRGVRLLQNQSYLFENSIDYMGFDLRDTGLHLILDKGIPGAVEKQIGPTFLQFLADHGLNKEAVDFFCIHPGGRKLLDEIEKVFAIESGNPHGTVPSRDCLREVGNLSSASILVVLKNIFERYAPKHGDTGLLAAFGPGFSAEMLLGTWIEAL